MRVFIFGASQMAKDYVAVLKNLNVNFYVVCRSHKSSSEFYKSTKIRPLVGGLDVLPDKKINKNDLAINAVGIGELAYVTNGLIDCGFKRILVEKPATISMNEILKLQKNATNKNVDIFVGYNRRFFQSVILAKKLIYDDGGVKSFHFDFTEWSHEIKNLIKPKSVLDTWVVGNSSHVIDLAFYLGGKPKEIQCLQSGGLPWHKSSAIFTGSGLTEKGALFSYHSNWESAGRWKLELNSKNYKFIFEPIEKLKIMRVGSIQIEALSLIDELKDEEFKPGLHIQVKKFIEGDYCDLCKLDEQKDMLKYYFQIAGYNYD